ERNDLVRACIRLPPVDARRREAQPQCIVMHKELLNNFMKQRDVEVLSCLEEHRLIPMVAVGNIEREEPMLRRCERDIACDQPLLGGPQLHTACHRCQFSNRLVCEELCWRKTETSLIGSGDDLNTEDRVTTQTEEVVVNAHALDAEKLLPDSC